MYETEYELLVVKGLIEKLDLDGRTNRPLDVKVIEDGDVDEYLITTSIEDTGEVIKGLMENDYTVTAIKQVKNAEVVDYYENSKGLLWIESDVLDNAIILKAEY